MQKKVKKMSKTLKSLNANQEKIVSSLKILNELQSKISEQQKAMDEILSLSQKQEILLTKSGNYNTLIYKNVKKMRNSFSKQVLYNKLFLKNNLNITEKFSSGKEINKNLEKSLDEAIILSK
jgi:replicative superfamily II helicase